MRAECTSPTLPLRNPNPQGDLKAACRAYNQSKQLSQPYDWQAAFRLWKALLLPYPNPNPNPNTNPNPNNYGRRCCCSATRPAPRSRRKGCAGCGGPCSWAGTPPTSTGASCRTLRTYRCSVMRVRTRATNSESLLSALYAIASVLS